MGVETNFAAIIQMDVLTPKIEIHHFIYAFFYRATSLPLKKIYVEKWLISTFASKQNVHETRTPKSKKLGSRT